MNRKRLADIRFRRPKWVTWLLEHLSPTENTFLSALAIATGVVCGLAAVGFHTLIEATHKLLYAAPALVQPWWLMQAVRAGLPAVGAVLAAAVIWTFARHDQGHGTPQVMEAVALRGGRLSIGPILTKVLGAGLVIGGGGSAGPEDPSVQIGAAVGSAAGQAMHLSDNRVKTLVTAGVASAIAAAFNAPMAGVFFAMEIVAGEFSAALFAPIVLAAVAASIVSRAALGAQPAFQVPAYELVNPLVETPLYGVLGLVAAGVGALLVRAIFWSEAWFKRLPLRRLSRAALGGLLVGLVGLAVPGALGMGYDTAERILSGGGCWGWRCWSCWGPSW